MTRTIVRELEQITERMVAARPREILRCDGCREFIDETDSNFDWAKRGSGHVVVHVNADGVRCGTMHLELVEVSTDD